MPILRKSHMKTAACFLIGFSLGGCTFGRYSDEESTLTFISILPGKTQSALTAEMEGKGKLGIERNQDNGAAIAEAARALRPGIRL